MEKQLFLLKNYGKHSKHEVIKSNDEEARTLIAEGKAVEVYFKDAEEYRKKADELANQYAQKVARIEGENHPTYTKEVRDYELSQAWREYEAQARQLEKEWEGKRKELLEKAKAKAAKATVHVTQVDRDIAEQVINRLILDVKGAQNNIAFNEALENAKDTLAYLTDGEKIAIQAKLPELLSEIEAKAQGFGEKASIGVLIDVVKDVDNLDLHAHTIANYLPNGRDIVADYHRKKLVKQAAQKKVI